MPSRSVVFFSLVVLLFGTISFLILAKDTPLNSAWNPQVPLRIGDPITPLTNFKFNRALRNDAACYAALKTGAKFAELPEKKEGASCGIRDHILLTSLNKMRVKPVHTRCQTALRWAMWAEHVVQPAAVRLLKTSVLETHHLSSYNCRKIRTSSGSKDRLSTHATAEAIDVSGFSLADGTKISLRKNWNGTGPSAKFLKDIRDGACDWFRVTLGPEFNQLHADHFHLQYTGLGLCR